MPSFALRDYQERLITDVQGALRQAPTALLPRPPAPAKPSYFPKCAAAALLKDSRVVVMVHRQELINQAVDKIREQAGVEPGVYWSHRRECHEKVVVASHGAVATGKNGWPGPHPDLMFIDEAHHTRAQGWMKAVDRIKPRYLVGFTATPFRFDRNPLSPVPFANILRSITPGELINRGVLVPPTVVTPVIAGPDGNPLPIGKSANLPDIYARAVQYALEQGRRKIILYVSSAGVYTPRENAKRAVAAISARNHIPAEAIDDSLSEKKRAVALARYRHTPAAALVNYATLTEGVDIPETDCLIIGRHTRSESSLIQMIGRGIRSYPGKDDCLVIDYTGRDDLHDMAHYYRTDEPRPEKESRRRKTRETPAEKAALQQAAARFPAQAKRMLGWPAEYPWLKPWPDAPLLALSLWRPAPENQRDPEGWFPFLYVRSAPARNGHGPETYTCGQASVKPGGAPPYRLEKRRGLSTKQAAEWIRDRITAAGARHHIRRDAAWRKQPATDGQRQYWQRATGSPAAGDSRRGEISDLLAQRQFADHIPVAATE